MPENYPRADIDRSGTCHFCRDYEKVDLGALERSRLEREKDLEGALRSCRGKGRYDCLVLLSGGKDSAYLLYKIKNEYRKRVLAFTCNSGGYIGDVALKNLRMTLDKLSLDHIFYTPSKEFYKKLFTFLLKNQVSEGAVRTVCYVCHPLTEGYALDIAVREEIPLILEAFSPGQPDPEVMLYELAERHIKEDNWCPKGIKESGLFSEEDMAHFWDPKRYSPDTQFPRVLAPFHAWRYDQTEVMKKVVELGLIHSKKYASPVYSNCMVNWLMMYSDLRNLGYNSYLFEFAKLIREGKADKNHWSVMNRIVNFMLSHRIFLGRQASYMLKDLGIKPEDLRITGRDEKEITSHHR
jgi:hypothetical protein